MLPPHHTIWLIEARTWAEEDTGEFVPFDPCGMGTGVAVELVPVDENGVPVRDDAGNLNTRRYLLTCSHVVRKDKLGPLAKEILCWEPGKGYSRTRPGERQKGREHAGSWRATVSPLSPCVADELPERFKAPCHDWVLLDIADKPGNSFQNKPTVEMPEGSGGISRLRAFPSFFLDKLFRKKMSLKLIGYPEGAGWLHNRLQVDLGEHYWETGDLVENTTLDDFELTGTSPDGTLGYRGPEDPRPGMSGGGVFDEDNRFIALHRSRAEQALRTRGIAVRHILGWLLRHRGHAPIPSQQSEGTRARIIPRPEFPAKVAAGMIIVILGGFALWKLGPWREKYYYKGKIVEMVDGMSFSDFPPVSGAVVVPIHNGDPFTDMQDTTGSDGIFEIVIEESAFFLKGADSSLRIEKDGFEPTVFAKRYASDDPNYSVVLPIKRKSKP